MRSTRGRGPGPPRPQSLFLAGGAVGVALLLSLLLSEIAHIRLLVYAHVHLYAAIFLATRTGGLLVGIAALVLTLVFSDFFLTEPLYVLFPIYDLPDYVTFSLVGIGAIWIGYLGRRMSSARWQRR